MHFFFKKRCKRGIIPMGLLRRAEVESIQRVQELWSATTVPPPLPFFFRKKKTKKMWETKSWTEKRESDETPVWCRDWNLRRRRKEKKRDPLWSFFPSYERRRSQDIIGGREKTISPFPLTSVSPPPNKEGGVLKEEVEPKSGGKGVRCTFKKYEFRRRNKNIHFSKEGLWHLRQGIIVDAKYRRRHT